MSWHSINSFEKKTVGHFTTFKKSVPYIFQPQIKYLSLSSLSIFGPFPTLSVVQMKCPPHREERMQLNLQEHNIVESTLQWPPSSLTYFSAPDPISKFLFLDIYKKH